MPRFREDYIRPRYHGGCLSNVIGLVIFPIFLVMFLFLTIFSFTSNSFYEVLNGGYIEYDENKFQDYANQMYKNEFGNSSSYEDNILLLFLADTKNYDNYYYIAFVGDHIKSEINYMLGNENTILGQALDSSININSYKYSLDSNIADAVTIVKNSISDLNLDTSFNCEEEHLSVTSHLTNKTTMDLTNETINNSLEDFTNKTGIPIVVVVEDIENVFPKKLSFTSILTIIISIVLIAFIIYSFYKKNKNKDNTIIEGKYYEHK